MALLEVSNLSVSFHTRNGVTKAVNNISFSLEQGQTLGIVGESGSGKSVCCYALLGLIPTPPGRIDSGSALFAGQDLLQSSEEQLRQLRGNKIAMIFQDPMTSLNPFLRIGEQMIEPLIYHRATTRSDARVQAMALLEEVGIRDPQNTFNCYPHEFSGGMRQRVMIAMALIAEPQLLIADEPTTALDVTVQKQIIELINQLRLKRNLSVIFISHDLGVVTDIADQVMVMHSGCIVEQGATRSLFNQPKAEYTRKLLAAMPRGSKPTASRATEHTLISVEQLTTRFNTYHQDKEDQLVAVNKVSFDLHRGEILGLVGESGSGKSTLGRSLLNLIPPSSGSVIFDGEQLVGKDARGMKPWRRRMQMIFQDPYASLNPRMTIYDALAEPLLLHGIATKTDVEKHVVQLMDDVGLARAYIRKYPHEFSGGQRQRIAIGRAIATKPEFIVADEPVSALDVTIQKQILELLLTLVEKHNLSMLFISHDLAVVRYLCDRIMVMRQGKILETATTETLWHAPQHEYTKTLLSSSSTTLS
jgi:ABC-type dipeptide/oligopeptide/nickel transport system ATPase component